MTGLFVPIVVLYLVVRGMNSVTDKFPQLMNSAHEKTSAMRGQADQLSNRVADPIVSAQNRMTKVERTLRSLHLKRKPDSRSIGKDK